MHRLLAFNQPTVHPPPHNCQQNIDGQVKHTQKHRQNAQNANLHGARCSRAGQNLPCPSQKNTQPERQQEVQRVTKRRMEADRDTDRRPRTRRSKETNECDYAKLTLCKAILVIGQRVFSGRFNLWRVSRTALGTCPFIWGVAMPWCTKWLRQMFPSGS